LQTELGIIFYGLLCPFLQKFHVPVYSLATLFFISLRFVSFTNIHRILSIRTIFRRFLRKCWNSRLLRFLHILLLFFYLRTIQLVDKWFAFFLLTYQLVVHGGSVIEPRYRWLLFLFRWISNVYLGMFYLTTIHQICWTFSITIVRPWWLV